MFLISNGSGLTVRLESGWECILADKNEKVVTAKIMQAV